MTGTRTDAIVVQSGRAGGFHNEIGPDRPGGVSQIPLPGGLSKVLGHACTVRRKDFDYPSLHGSNLTLVCNCDKILHMNRCSNPECAKELVGPSQKKFCSRSCATVFNNKNMPSRRPKGSCATCGMAISKSKVFCSVDCRNANRKPKPENDGKKRCSSCHQILPISSFGINRTTRDKLMRQCRVCNNSRVNKYNKNNSKRVYGKPAYLRHGLSRSAYENLMDKQGWSCAICNVKSDKFVIDHDHACCPGAYSCGNCIRGVLCHSCNSGIGFFADSVDRLTSAMLYLQS